MTVMLLKHTLELVHAGQICDFDMSQTTVGGKRLFNMGIVPRADMPQLKGFPRPASVAELLRQDDVGKVNVMDQFLSYVTTEIGVKPKALEMNASELRGSQRELVASKVAKHALKMLDRRDHKKLHATYVVSDENVLIDGHHGWAAVRCYETMIGQKIKLDVLRLNCDIDGLLKLARQFVNIVGIENKEGV